MQILIIVIGLLALKYIGYSISGYRSEQTKYFILCSTKKSNFEQNSWLLEYKNLILPIMKGFLIKQNNTSEVFYVN